MEFKSKTVFVLGAGASMPYGFPSGPALRHEICTQALVEGDSRYAVLADMGYTSRELNACREAIAGSWASSIDMFLATRSDYRNIAKSAIALTIALYERQHQKLFFAEKQDWFRFLWKHLFNTQTKRLQPDMVAFVTFNYDRTLEHALASGMTHALGAMPGLELIPEIVHVYGSIGAYPFEGVSPPTRPYGIPMTHIEAREAARSIWTMDEKNPESTLPAKACKLLAEAAQIMFLGFGFDEDNMKLMGFRIESSRLQNSCRIWATAMGLTGAEARWAQTQIGKPGNATRVQMGGHDVDSLLFLREHIRELRN